MTPARWPSALRAAGYEVLLSDGQRVRRAAGRREAGATVRSGALDEAELARLVEGAAAVVDATHPFAAQISAAAAASGRAPAGRTCASSGRPASCPTGVAGAPTKRHARRGRRAWRASWRAARRRDPAHGRQQDGRHVRSGGARGRACAWSRACCPTPESLAACAAAGLEPRDIVAMQGPTSAELDAALLRHLGATVLVTKESGDAGGLDEKLRAAELVGATVVVVERPAEPSRRADRAVLRRARPSTRRPRLALAWLATYAAWLCRCRRAEARLSRGLLQVYTGDGKGKTTAAVGQALRARGAGLAVTFVQFVKGGRESSELAPLRAAGVHVVRPARRAQRPAARRADRRGSRRRRRGLGRGPGGARRLRSCDLVVLDELHAALRHGLVELGEVLAALAARPAHQEVVTTGRGAPGGATGRRRSRHRDDARSATRIPMSPPAEEWSLMSTPTRLKRLQPLVPSSCVSRRPRRPRAHVRRHRLARRQERARRGVVPHLRAARLPRGAVQGAEHGAQLVRHAGRAARSAARRPSRPRAAGIEPHVDMNPVLLKPSSQTGSQVIVLGPPRAATCRCASTTPIRRRSGRP